MDIGTELRMSRETRGLSLAALAQRTRVQPRILAAIEQNDRTAIPPRPFGRGFVHAYAREIGLDPERTVREYFGQFAAPSDAVMPDDDAARSTADSQGMHKRVLATVSTAVAVVAVAAFLLFRNMQGSSRPPETQAVGTSGATGAGAVVPAVNEDSRAVARPVPARATSGSAINIVLVATGTCWVSATADGKRVVYQLLAPGARLSLQARENVSIRAGDAGALAWTINGRDVGRFGAPGAVRDVTVTTENSGTIR